MYFSFFEIYKFLGFLLLMLCTNLQKYNTFCEIIIKKFDWKCWNKDMIPFPQYLRRGNDIHS